MPSSGTLTPLRLGSPESGTSSWTGFGERRALANLDPEEQIVVDFTRELLQHRRPTFDSATARFGQRGTMTLTNLIACYAVLAYNMNTYDLEAPAHPTEPGLTL